MSQEGGSADGSVVVDRDSAVLRLGSTPTVTIGLATQAIHYGQGATVTPTVNQKLFNLDLCRRTTDFKQGVAALHEKRPPQFRGR